VPFEDASNLPLNELAAYYKNKYGLTIEMLPSLSIEPEAIDDERDQLIADELLNLMARRYPNLARDRQAILIGITTEDMYPKGQDWQFVFSSRIGFQGDDRPRFAVVSTARMDPEFLDEPANPQLLQRRLRKMITKNIGMMYYRLPQNGNPRSVLYDSILSVSALDCVGEDF
jgi:predicted Zn-dependent protease